MGRYGHLGIEEREEIMRMLRGRRPLSEIARAIGRDKSTVSREAARNGWTVGAGGGRAERKGAAEVAAVMARSLAGHRLETVTPDRGSEFARHAEVTGLLGVEFYFALPRHPWQRGTNENTNGLLREYFPKGCDLSRVTETEVQAVYDKLNRSPRRRLGYQTPFEVYYDTSLHLI